MWMTRRIDDRRSVGIQLSQPIDQRKSFRCAGQARLTHRMIPHQSCDVCIEEKRSDRGRAGIECELRSPSEIKNAFFRVRGWRVGVKEGPAAIKDGLSQFL